MKYFGDILAASTLTFFFNTKDASNVPTTLAGTPVCSVYKDSSSTESTAGVTLSVDFDSRTGMHKIIVDTSADGTFYAAGGNFRVVITTGTVSGVSWVGTVVGEFSLENRTQKADIRKVGGDAIPATNVAGALPVDTIFFSGNDANCDNDGLLQVDMTYINGGASVGAQGYAALDWAQVRSPSTAHNFSGTTVGTATNLTNLPSIPANWLTATGIAAGALNGKGDWPLSTADFNATQKNALNAATPASVQNISAQTGDAYARIGAAGASLTALGDTRLANLDATVSSRNATTPPTTAAITAAVLAGIVDGAISLGTVLKRINAWVRGKTVTASVDATNQQTTYYAEDGTTPVMAPTYPKAGGDTQ